MSKKIQNDGKDFEELTHNIFQLLSNNESYTSVARDIELSSPDGPRQFDVVLRSKVAGLNILTVIECKDHSRRVSVGVVDAFISKMLDVQANKGVIVASNGFTEGAKKKARRLGVSLCNVYNIDKGFKDIGFEVPIVIKEVSEISISCNMLLDLKKGDSFKRNILPYVGGRPLDEVVNEYFNNEQNLPELNLEESNEWLPDLTDGCYIYDDVNEKNIDLQKLTVNYSFKVLYYFGYMSDLPNTLGHTDILENKRSIFLNEKDITHEYKKTFARYSKLEQLPSIEGINLIIQKMPKVKFLKDKFLLNRINKV